MIILNKCFATIVKPLVRTTQPSSASAALTARAFEINSETRSMRQTEVNWHVHLEKLQSSDLDDIQKCYVAPLFSSWRGMVSI